MPRLALAAAVALALPASATLTKLGIYDYFTDESTPVLFNGALLMFESIVQNSPQWAGHWLPAFANCTSYFRVRDQLSGVVLVNLTQTCEHAFGFAMVQTGDAGLDTLYVYGTQWIRAQAPPPGVGTHRGSRLGWGGPCSQSNCSVDAFYTSDPELQQWTSAGAAISMGYATYNTDVAHVGAPSSSTAAAARLAALGAAGADLPPHQWVMILETAVQPSGRFWVSNSSDPTDSAAWAPLDPAAYTLDTFGNGQIGSCPSIRYDPASGYYYVLTGGDAIVVLRSRTLAKGSWQLGSGRGVVLGADAGDCRLAGAPYGAWFNLSVYVDAVAHVAACLADPSGPGFGYDSDVDLSEVLVSAEWLRGVVAGGGSGAVLPPPPPASAGDAAVATLVQYGSGDQKSFGFSNLAIAPGGLFALLESFF